MENLSDVNLVQIVERGFVGYCYTPFPFKQKGVRTKANALDKIHKKEQTRCLKSQSPRGNGY